MNDLKYDQLIESYDNNLKMFSDYAFILNSIFKDGNLIEQSEYFSLNMNDLLPFNIVYDINMIYFNQKLSNEEKYEKIKILFVNFTNKLFKVVLIDRYFKEVPYNFLLNLNILIDFNLTNLVISE